MIASFPVAGGVICFFTEANRIRFEIDSGTCIHWAQEGEVFRDRGPSVGQSVASGVLGNASADKRDFS